MNDISDALNSKLNEILGIEIDEDSANTTPSSANNLPVPARGRPAVGAPPHQLTFAPTPLRQKPAGSNADIDLEHARDVILDLIAKGELALEQMMMIAAASQHPRAYEVVNLLIKTLSETSQDLLHARHKHKEITQTHPSNVKVDKAVFVGSTADLQKLIGGSKRVGEVHEIIDVEVEPSANNGT